MNRIVLTIAALLLPVTVAHGQEWNKTAENKYRAAVGNVAVAEFCNEDRFNHVALVFLESAQKEPRQPSEDQIQVWVQEIRKDLIARIRQLGCGPTILGTDVANSKAIPILRTQK